MGKSWTSNNADSTNTEAKITIPAKPNGVAVEIEALEFSYDGTPTTPQLLTVESPENTIIRRWWVTAGGPGPISFSGSCIRGAAGQAMVIRLPADASRKGAVNATERGP